MATIARVFLDWQQPLLVTAVEWLARKYSVNGEFDLSRVSVVVPGKRAGRRLLELLVQHAEAHSLRLFSPDIETLGSLPEQLYPLQRPLAGDLVQQLAWASALRAADPATLARIAPQPPAADDATAWWSLGRLLWTQHNELAADGLNFADVAELGRDVPGFDEGERWDALRVVQETYLRTLDDLGLWDVQTARLIAIKQREPHTERDIVLLGTADMHQATRQMLDLVAERVTALIAAPAELAERFDSHGCLLPAVWAEAHIDLPNEHVRVCDGPGEQAAQVAMELAAFQGRYRSDEVVVGLADNTLASFVTRRLAISGVATRWIEAHPLMDAGPCRLLRAVADYLKRGRFADFATLVRHPDLGEWLSRSHGGIDLAALDAAFGERLSPSPNALRSFVPASSSVAKLCNAVEELLEPLQGPPRELSQWIEPLRELLRTLYGDRVLEETSLAGRVLAESLKRLQTVLQEFNDAPQALAPVVSTTDALEGVLQRMLGEFVPPDTDPTAVELLGWLELPWDDTPAAIVTAFNEGSVPTSLNSDLFLPNELRRRLGLNDNARRFARDAYAVSLLRHTRREIVWLVGRRDAEGNPLLPSRLLFATEAEQLPDRVLRLLQSRKPSVESRELDKRPDSRLSTLDSRLSIPHPVRVAELLNRADLLAPASELTLRVTEFRAFLECPYRYFLRHVLELKPLVDDGLEMDGRLFGTVLHEVLCQFGQSDLWRLTDADKLRGGLSRLLDEVAQRQFGARRRAAVEIQLQQMRLRLQAFADWQTSWRREGWAIEMVEASVQPQVDSRGEPAFVADGVPVWLRGRIDRIDRNERTGDCVIFDYKSGDDGDPPEKKHRKKNAWIDLQLPLYRHLARSLSLPDEPRLGYIVLPKDISKTGAKLAEWSPDELADADATAREVACRIARREFWPPADLPTNQRTDFDDICQVGVFGQTLPRLMLD